MEHDSQNESGAAAVEFALVLPILVMLLFGIIQFGTAFNQKQGLHAAAREGARVGSISTSTQQDINDMVTRAMQGVTGPTPKVAIEPDVTIPCGAAEAVVVTVSSPADINIPFFGNSQFELIGRGEFRCER